jgi:3-deoxy-D-arabino-heptulosonate 7-phosphate (DAHP) synthase
MASSTPATFSRKLTIPRTADGWDLYSESPGADEAADTLSRLLEEKLTAAYRVGLNDEENAGRIRQEMYEEMEVFRTLGARDTEPQLVLVRAIEASFGLESGSLSR